MKIRPKVQLWWLLGVVENFEGAGGKEQGAGRDFGFARAAAARATAKRLSEELVACAAAKTPKPVTSGEYHVTCAAAKTPKPVTGGAHHVTCTAAKTFKRGKRGMSCDLCEHHTEAVAWLLYHGAQWNAASCSFFHFCV